MLLRDASFAFLMVLRDRAKQADFLFPLRSCAPFASRKVLRDEPVGLRSEESLLFLSRLHASEGETWQRNHPHHQRAPGDPQGAQSLCRIASSTSPTFPNLRPPSCAAPVAAAFRPPSSLLVRPL